jgi:hypothetical protein
MAPIIKFTREAEVKLTAWNIATKGREFSGLGLIEKFGEVFWVMDVDLLGVGSTGFTEFSPERAHTLPLDPRRKLWFHKHPISGWSGQDEYTATKEPLGGPPQLVKWSVAIVRTPNGWIGRVDIHAPQAQTFHCPVEPNLPAPEVIVDAQKLITPELDEYIDVLLKEFYATRPGGDRMKEGDHRVASWRESDFDVYDYSDAAEMYCSECGAPLQEEVEVVDIATGELLPTYGCTDCGNIYVITSSVTRAKPQPSWKQASWWQRALGKG